MHKIIKAYKQSIPETRFIGIKYGDGDRDEYGSFGEKWGLAHASDLFGKIESAVGIDKIRVLYEDSDAYVGLMRCNADEPFQYWIGMFTPAGSPVPDGMEYVDFVASELGIAWIYGDEGDVFCHDDECVAELTKIGCAPKNDESGSMWFFERYQCPRYTTPDDDGKIILDSGYFI